MKQKIRSLIVRVLSWEAETVLKKYKPVVIAVTGNVGKTSTKEAIAAILEPHFKIRKSEKTYNSEFGVPLTILGLKTGWNNPFLWIKNIIEGLFPILFTYNYPTHLVLEVGADHPGDIKAITKYLPVHVAVVTEIGPIPVHVEYFSSPEELAREKGVLVEVVPKDGTVILNHDSPRVSALRSLARTPNVLTFGKSNAATIRTSEPRFVFEDGKPKGLAFQADFRGKSVPIEVEGVLGSHVVMTLLPALLVGATFGVGLIDMIESLKKYLPPPGRMRVIPGLKGSVIIDDTYNSSPKALEAALDTLETIPAEGRKIAVLGDMLELGPYTIPAHESAGEQASRVADVLFAVGQRARFFAESAEKAGMSRDKIFTFDTSREAHETIQNFIKEGDIVLVKGSQYMRMERITYEIMAEPARASELLVRQDKEWKAKV